MTSQLVEQLVRLGFLVEVVTAAGAPAAYQPSRPPETTTIASVLAALRGDGVALAPQRLSVELQAVGAVMERMRGGEREALAGETLAQLIAADGF